MTFSANALLIGNDINNLSPGYSWEDLLTELVGFVGGTDRLSILKEQFPLFYEEIYAFARRQPTKSEVEIKQFISDKVQGLQANKVHRALVELGVKDILTTNYEFTLEQAMGVDGSKLENEGEVSESRYSLFRKFNAANKHIWHIHGDALRPRTIALGYEHYAGYLQNMRNYVVSGTGDSYKEIRLDSLVKRLNRGDRKTISWVDIFFTHNIHIIGLSLDFVEIHLWWLLTFRGRASSDGTRKTPHNNRIVYYYPKSVEKRDQTKLRLLAATNVELQLCAGSDKEAYYKSVTEKIRTSLGRRQS